MLALFLTFAFAGPYDGIVTTKASSTADEYALGKAYVDGSRWLVGAWDNPEQQLRVERITRRIVANSDRPDLVFNVTVLASMEVNACALPGGFMFVNRGLLEKVDDNQLAFVLAHELSHVTLRHSTAKSNLQTATKSVAGLQGAQAGADRATAAARADELYQMLAGHSRQLELEADLYGLLYLVRAGYPSSGGIGTMEVLKAASGGEKSKLTLAWASHPMFSDRIEQLGKGTEALKKAAGRFDEGTRLLLGGRNEQAVTAFQEFLSAFPQSQAGWANLGAAWLFQDPAHKTDPWVDLIPLHSDSGIAVRSASTVFRERARDALAKSMALGSDDPVTLGLLAILSRREGDLAASKRFIDQGLDVSPTSVPLLVARGNLAAVEGKLAAAMVDWEDAVKAFPEAPEPKVNLARAWTQKKMKKKAVEAWTALAENPKWAAEASAALDALAAKPAAKKKAAVAVGAAETLTVGATTLVPGAPEAVLAGLGPSDYEDTYETGVEGTVDVSQFWYAHNLQVVVHQGKVVEIGINDPSSVKTASGLGVPVATGELITTLGQPGQTNRIGESTFYSWPARGITAVAYDGVVYVLSLWDPSTGGR